MRIWIIYHDGEVKKTDIDSEDWLKAPENILAITYFVNGVKQEVYGFGAYFVIDDYIGGFNTITGFNGNRKRYFPCETFLVDPRVKMGKEISDDDWKEVRKLI